MTTWKGGLPHFRSSRCPPSPWKGMQMVRRTRTPAHMRRSSPAGMSTGSSPAVSGTTCRRKPHRISLKPSLTSRSQVKLPTAVSPNQGLRKPPPNFGRQVQHGDLEEAKMKDIANTGRVRLERCLPSYWRVTFDHPPLNIFDQRAFLD